MGSRWSSRGQDPGGFQKPWFAGSIPLEKALIELGVRFSSRLLNGILCCYFFGLWPL